VMVFFVSVLTRSSTTIRSAPVFKMTNIRTRRCREPSRR
jgi:hypothetical protein